MRLALLAVGAMGSQTGSPAMYKVVEMLRGVKTTTENDLKSAQKTYTKVDCTVTSTMKKNAKLREENAEKIEDAQAELDALDSTTLTDEAERLVSSINGKKAEKKDADNELQKLTDTHDAYQADLQAGIDALNAAQGELQKKGSLLSTRRITSLLATKLAPKHRDMIESAMKVDKQAPAAYESQLGTIITLVKNLIVQYGQEQIDGNKQFQKQKSAMEAMISELATAIADLQAALESGDGEAAAKMKRKKELDTLIADAVAENQAADAEDADMKALDKENKDSFNKFEADATAKMAAIDKALDILHNDEARAHFHKVADESGTFLLQRSARVSRANAKASVSSEMSASALSAVQTLLTAIDDFSTELDTEATSITDSISSCTSKSNNALEAAKQAAEQVDGFSASIASLEATIASEQEKQRELTTKIEEETAAKIEANEKFAEEVAELTAAKKDLIEAALISGKAIGALKEYGPQDGSPNPLDSVITMLNSLKSGFQNDADDRQNEVDNLTKINTDMNKRVGTQQDFDAESIGKDAAVVTVADDASIIGGLEGERNVSLTEENSAAEKKVTEEGNKAASLEVLYGQDGTTGVLGDFKGMQPGCDYWMINGPGRKDAIIKEKAALTAARQVLSSKDLGLAAGDEASLDAREAGADAKKHEQAHVAP
jgi:chromosome segregation ATPase